MPVSAIHWLLRVPWFHYWPLSDGCIGVTALPVFTPFLYVGGSSDTGWQVTQNLAAWLRQGAAIAWVCRVCYLSARMRLRSILGAKCASQNPAGELQSQL